MGNKSYVIGICGGTCSGKTTLARNLHERLKDHSLYISQDSYYKDQSHKTESQIKEHNFDHPDSIDFDLLYQNIRDLQDNKEITVPEYCFKTHSRLDGGLNLEPAKLIIIEGILIFTNEKLRNLLDYRVYVDVDADIRLIRRINRDIEDRGRCVDSVINQYLMTVKPMHDAYVESVKKFSDMIVDSQSFYEKQDELIEILVDKL